MNRLLFSGGPIHTMKPGAPGAESLLVEGERIVAAGSMETVARRAEGAQHVDLAGASLMPGFIDAHHHFCIAALDRRAADLHHPAGCSVADLLQRVGGWLDGDPEPGWARAHGWDATKLAERRPPTRAELDEVCPDRPLLLAAYSFHEGVVNSRGLEALGLERSSPDPAGRRARSRSPWSPERSSRRVGVLSR